LRKKGLQYDEILEEMRAKYATEYSLNYLASVIGIEIPNRIAKIAKINRMEIETP